MKANKALASLRNAMKRALQSSKKANNNVEDVVPNMVKAMLEVEPKSTDGRINVPRVTTVTTDGVMRPKTVTITVLPAEVFQKLERVTGVLAHIRWTSKQLKGETKNAISSFKAGIRNTFSDVLKLTIPDFVCNLPLPSEHSQIGQVIFAPQTFALTEHFSNVGVTPYCTNEHRILYEGGYMMAGVQLSDIPGDTLTQKIENVCGVGLGNFMSQVQVKQNGAFFVVHDEIGSVLTIPAGFLTITCGKWEQGEGASGVRFSFLTLRVCHTPQPS